jgi:hypothetical protein
VNRAEDLVGPEAADRPRRDDGDGDGAVGLEDEGGGLDVLGVAAEREMESLRDGGGVEPVAERELEL